MRPRLPALIQAVCLAAVAVASLSFISSDLRAQATGRIVGRVLDAESGSPLTDVGVQVTGTRLGTMSGVEGRYAITAVPAGTVEITARRLGFAPKTITGVTVEAGKTLELNISLQTATITLQTQVVTASAERGSVADALDAQKTATMIVSAVTSEQISKSPDSDAGQAVQRVSGVTVQGGKYVFVRGLGERYTTTQLNGTRVPSPEPEKRVVPLDMFPSGLLENVTTSKTFTPDQQGDFSGAQVDIKTREFPARRAFSFALTTGYNPDATGKSILTAARAGGENFANVGSKRDLPGTIKSLGNFENVPLNQGDINRLVGMFRNSWSPELSSAPPNLSTSFSLGGNDPLLFGHRIGYLLSGTYANTREIEKDQIRAFASRGTTPGSTIETDRFEGETGNVGVLWGGLTNVSTVLGTHSRISVNNTYSRTADNEARSEVGDLENEAIRVRIDRMQYVERSVRSSQAAGEHQLGEPHKLDWAVTSSAVRRDEPDRSEFVSVVESGTGANEVLRWLNSSNQGAVRTFSELNEDALEYRANYQLNFPAFGRQHFVKVGGLHRSTDRDADTRSFSISAPGADDVTRALRPEELFDGRFTTSQAALFDLDALSQGGAYTASDELSAGYVMTELALTSRFRLIGGARYERDELSVNAVSTLGNPARTDKAWTDVLPSLALNVQLTEAQNLRISFSGTLARPEYRELSPIKSRDVLNGDNLEGNPDLQRTRIRNADVRWEWYPASGEALTIGVFAKQFDDPIERVYRAGGASSRFVAFVNAEEATNYGIELEVRKNLGFLNEQFAPFSLFSNVTMMESSIKLGSAQSAATNSERRMVGQAPYVLNVGLAYATASGNTSATLLFNRVGERIEAAGDQPLPDLIQNPRNVLDFSLRFPIAGAMSGRLDAKNLLDAPFETVQGTVTREYWKVGRVLQVGVLFRP